MGTDNPTGSEIPLPVSAKNKSSFAYYTVNARLPVTIAQLADGLCRKKDQLALEYGKESSDELKSLIGRLSKLRYEVQTNKPLVPLESDAADVSRWNEELAAQVAANDGQAVQWYTGTFLFVENYMYRALQDYVALTETLKSYDIFGDQKRASYMDSVEPVRSLMTYVAEVTKNVTDVDELFTEFIQIALWGNKCDLSISQGAANSQKQCVLEQLSHLKSNILIDDTTEALATLRKAAALRGGQASRVDIVLDNAGFELVTDLALAEVLTATGLASCIHFHGKALPWFVSDVTREDWAWALDSMGASDDAPVSHFSRRWKGFLESGTWVFKDHAFWTLPYDYSLMRQYAPDLYSDLAQADVVFFKGDLNYRKLVGDRGWAFTTDFAQSLRGFHPAPVCSLRALKCDVVAGLRPGQAEEVAARDSKWQVSGNWAAITFTAQVAL